MPFNILVVIEQNSWMDAHIADSLKSMGHTVTRFYYGNYIGDFYGTRRRKERKQRNLALLNIAKMLKATKRLDLIFCFVYDDFLLPRYAKALADLNVPMVNYNVDMPTQWFRQIRIAPYFDIMLCGQHENMEHLARYAKKVLYFPMASRTFEFNNTATQLESTYEVTFLGMAFPYRRQVLSELARQSVPLTIFGKYWESSQSNIYTPNIEESLSFILYYSWPRLRAEGLKSLWAAFLNRFYVNHKKVIDTFIPKEILKGSVSNASIPSLFHCSKINIGFTRYANNNPNIPGRCQMKLRDFEVPMAGGFYLIEKSPGYDEIFTDGEEVVTWQTLPELLEKIKYYLEHETEREAIALAGQKRAMRDHTWEVRFNTLFSKLQLLSDK